MCQWPGNRHCQFSKAERDEMLLALLSTVIQWLLSFSFSRIIRNVERERSRERELARKKKVLVLVLVNDKGQPESGVEKSGDSQLLSRI